jgi:hypothetical protein
VAAAAIGAHLAWPTVGIDGVTVVLLVVALLPWFSPLVKAVELPGGWKIELQEIQKRVDDAHGAALSAGQKADVALGDVRSRGTSERRPEDLGRIGELAERYNEIRRTQRSGAIRTSDMTAVVRSMMEVARSVDRPYATADALRSSDPGTRLFAYAYLNARPEGAPIADLVESLTRAEDKPFGQYWGILALGEVIRATSPAQIGAAELSMLRDFKKKLEPGTDREYELKRILGSLPDSP